MRSEFGLGLYLHTPFCRQKCAYCDFNSYAGLEWMAGRYTRAVIQQIRQVSADMNWPDVTTIFFGGGNPALLGAEGLTAILASCRQKFHVCADAEVTLEINPEDAHIDLLRLLRKSGFNRLSIGWQSLDDELLTMLGRRHTAKQAMESIKIARKAGFENISIDMICGLPGQTQEAWLRELEQAADCEPDHISAYILSIEPGTLLESSVKAGLVHLPDDEATAKMYVQTEELLKEAGFTQYEISNYCRDNSECRHNLNYWAGGDYLGFGAGAHSHWRGRRWWSVAEPKEFIDRTYAGDPTDGFEELSPAQRLSERIFLGLRLNKGVNWERIGREFGDNMEERYQVLLAELRDMGLINKDRTFALTQKGRLLANEVMAEFI